MEFDILIRLEPETLNNMLTSNSYLMNPYSQHVDFDCDNMLDSIV